MIPIIIVSQDDKIDARVWNAVRALNQPVVHLIEERKAFHPELEKNRCLNIARARTMALKQALKRHKRAEHFLFLDSDIVPPSDIFERFNETAADGRVLGAWWRTRFGGSYVGGHWSGGVVKMFQTIHRGHRLTETHFLSLGCTLVPRQFLEGPGVQPHTFAAGIDQFVRNPAGQLFHIADSGAFSQHVSNSGGRMFLDSEVIAEHITEGQPINY